MSPSLRPALLAALAALVLAHARPASACTCLEPPSVEASRAAAVAVFTGVPRAIASAAPEHPGAVWVTFDVAAVWKGAVTPQYAVLTPESGATCGIDFDLDVEWLVYAFPSGNEADSPPFTHLCSRTAHAAGNPDFAVLGPPVSTPSATASWGRLKTLYR